MATTVAVTAVDEYVILNDGPTDPSGWQEAEPSAPAWKMAPLGSPLNVPLMEEPETIVYLVPTVWSHSREDPEAGGTELHGAAGDELRVAPPGVGLVPFPGSSELKAMCVAESNDAAPSTLSMP